MKRLFGMANSLKDQPRAQVAQLERRLFLGRGLSLGALTLLSGCNVTDQESRAEGAVGDVALERSRAGLDLRSQPARAGVPGEPRSRSRFRSTRSTAMDEVPRVDAASYKLEICRARAREEAVDAARALRAAPGLAGDAPHLRRGLERDRQVERRALQRFPAAHRRRPDREVRGVQVRGQVPHQHRHGDRAASADAAHVPASPTRSCRRSSASR